MLVLVLVVLELLELVVVVAVLVLVLLLADVSSPAPRSASSRPAVVRRIAALATPDALPDAPSFCCTPLFAAAALDSDPEMGSESSAAMLAKDAMIVNS